MKTISEKNIFDYKSVKNVSAIALLKDGKEAGKIVCNWSDNPAGSVCTAQVFLYGEQYGTKKFKETLSGVEHEFSVPMIGKAGGYGYDKRSQAIYDALRKQDLHKVIKVEPASGNERTAFEAAGFTWFEIC